MYFSISIFFILLLLLSSRFFSVEKGRFGIERFFLSNLIFYYTLIPILYLLSFSELKKNTHNFWVLNTTLDEFNVYFSALLVSLGVLFILLGMISGQVMSFKSRDEGRDRFKYFVIFICFLSTSANFFYFYKVGFLDAIINANLYRAHGLMENPIGIFSKLQPLVVIGSLILLPFRTYLKWFFVVVSVCFLLAEASRTNTGMYFIVMFLYWININKKFTINKLIFPFLVGLFLAFAGNSITDYVETGFFKLPDTIYYTILSQFSPGYSNILNVGGFVDSYGYGYFRDSLSFFYGKEIVRSWQLLTEYYLGGFWNVGIPIDIFTYGYSQASFLGLIVVCYFLGVSVSLVKSYLLSFYHGDELGFKVSTVMQLIMGLFFSALVGWASFDITVFVGLMKYWIFFVGLVFFSNFRILR